MADRIIVCIDTTETFGDLRLVKLDWMQLLALCAAGKIEIEIPDAVFRETVRHQRRQVADAYSAIKSKLDTLAKLGEPVDVNLSSDPGAEGYEDYFAGRLATVGAVVQPLPDVPLQQLLKRDLSKLKPFNDVGRGMRDALNWYSVLSLAEKCDASDRVFWVTGNHKDFATSAGSDLHSDLLADLEDIDCKVSRATSIRALLDSPLLASLVADLETTPEALEQFLHLAEDSSGADLAPTPEALVTQAIEEASASLSNGDEEIDFLGDGGIAIEGPVPAFESGYLTYLEPDMTTVSWQAYDTFDDTTWMISASASAAVEVTGYVHKSDVHSLQSASVSDWDWNDHYVEAVWSFEAVLTFQLRLELDVGVDYTELESIVVADVEA